MKPSRTKNKSQSEFINQTITWTKKLPVSLTNCWSNRHVSTRMEKSPTLRASKKKSNWRRNSESGPKLDLNAQQQFDIRIMMLEVEHQLNWQLLNLRGSYTEFNSIYQLEPEIRIQILLIYILAMFPICSIELFPHLRMFRCRYLSPSEAFL